VFGRARGESDRGDVILGWLTKIVVFSAVIGVIGFDAISISTSRLGAEDDANAAASAASDTWQETHKLQLAYDAAAEVAQQHGETVPPRSLTIGADGTVHLTVVRTATTLLVHRIGPLRHLDVVREHGSATPPVE